MEDPTDHANPNATHPPSEFDIMLELLRRAPTLALPPQGDSTWREVGTSEFDLSDLYGRRK